MRRLLVVAVLAGGVLGWAAPSYADAPSAQGWWNAANMGFAQPPDPPDVPPDGLLLQGGLSGPSAYGALLFTLPADVTGASLTLDVASSATQATAVQACPAKPGWKPVQGGPLADAPAYDCARSVAAVLSADGKQLLFRDVTGLATAEGVLSIALVPGESDRVALSKPSATALTVQQGDTTTAAPPPPVAPPPVDSGPATAAPPVTAAAPIVPVAPAPAQQLVPPAVAAPGAAPVAAPARQAQQAAAKSRATTTGVRLVLLAEALLTLISFGLLGIGPARGLIRLTGVEARSAERARGIGRFTRERVGSAPSL